MDGYRDFLEGKQFLGAIGMHNITAPVCAGRKNDQGIKAYHVLWTKPSVYSGISQTFSMTEYELATARLSAAAWRRYNGSICLITDHCGAEYMKAQKMDECYDEILDILDDSNYGVYPKKYWAAGKIQALERIKAPCVLLDMDMIIWKRIETKDVPLIVAHHEYLHEMVYPDFSYFNMKAGYDFPKVWSELARPLNTSFVYFADEDFKKTYVKESVRFMRNERNTPDVGMQCMVFAEQRILGMCAEAEKIAVRTLVDYENLMEKQDFLTHLWSGKHYLYREPELQKIYISLCDNKRKDLERVNV